MTVAETILLVAVGGLVGAGLVAGTWLAARIRLTKEFEAKKDRETVSGTAADKDRAAPAPTGG